MLTNGTNSPAEPDGEQLDEDMEYSANQLDRDVVAPDQIRKVIQTFRGKLFTKIFPGRKQVPKTLIFAKDDSHAEDILRIIHEEFGKGNDFCKKITYRTTAIHQKICSPVSVIHTIRVSL